MNLNVFFVNNKLWEEIVMEKNNQTIKCNVSSCRYNEDNCMCTLDEIKVGCECGCHPTSARQTVCDSYKYDKD